MKKLFALFLCAVLLFSFCACSKPNPAKQTEGETSGTAEAPLTADPNAPESLFAAFSGLMVTAAEGNLEKFGMSSLTRIRSAADFSPFRSAFSGYGEEEIAEYLTESKLKGYVAVLEIFAPSANVEYGLDSLTREGDIIYLVMNGGVLEVPEGEEPFDMPSDQTHHFLLFSIDSAVYNGEDVQFLINEL